LYGLTGSGKATIAFELERRLFDEGREVTVLYGPDMRQGLCRDLGFTADDRSENLRRSSEVAKILNDAGVICVCAFVAPHDAVREKARQVIGTERCVSVWLNAPVEVCRQRDRSGAYSMADSGKIGSFPGVSAAFEPPASADLALPTHEIDVDECVERIVGLLRERGFVGR
jgi:bifunctional enzyme CysN/CysC